MKQTEILKNMNRSSVTSAIISNDMTCIRVPREARAQEKNIPVEGVKK
jgi:hypothetical protein